MISNEQPDNNEQSAEPKSQAPAIPTAAELIPALFAAIVSLGGVIGVPKQVFDNFPKDFGVKIEYVPQKKLFILSAVGAKRRGVLRPKPRTLILPN